MNRIQEIADDEKGVATCIFCGKPLQGHEVVLYRDWHVHKECADGAINKVYEDFDRTPFYAGSISLLFGILAAILLLQGLSPIDITTGPRMMIPGFAFMAAALLLQSIGFYGFTATFKDFIGLGGSILAITGAVFLAISAALLQVFGYDPAFYDPETGFLVFDLLPGYTIAYALAIGFVTLTLMLIAIILFLYEDIVARGSSGRGFAVIVLISALLSPLHPVGLLAEAFIVSVVFLSVEIPKDWRGMSVT